MTSNSKLYVILRAGLDAGLKIAQAVHAYKAFAVAYPEVDQDWFAISNNIVILEYDDLNGLTERLERHGLALARFHEPDRNDELTAICVEPRARRRVSDLKLAA